MAGCLPGDWIGSRRGSIVTDIPADRDRDRASRSPLRSEVGGVEPGRRPEHESGLPERASIMHTRFARRSRAASRVDGVDPGRRHRLPGQDSLRRGDEQGPDVQVGPEMYAASHQAAARDEPVREIDASSVIAHRLPLQAVPAAHKAFHDEQANASESSWSRESRRRGRHRAMASRSTSVDGRVSAFRTGPSVPGRGGSPPRCWRPRSRTAR